MAMCSLRLSAVLHSLSQAIKPYALSNWFCTLLCGGQNGGACQGLGAAGAQGFSQTVGCVRPMLAVGTHSSSLAMAASNMVKRQAAPTGLS